MSAGKPIPYEDALELAGNGKMQRWITFAGAMCLLCSYLNVSNISFVLPGAQCDLELTSKGKGALIASGFIGIILSSHFWGFLSDILGRRYILTRCLIADGILYICSSFVPNYWLFLLMRLLNGFSSCGGVVSSWAYIGEFHTDKYRTRAIMIASVIGTSIYFLLPCLAWLIFPLTIEIPLYRGVVFKSWRLFYMLCGFPSLLTSLLMMTLPESPKFLLASGEKEKSIKVLQYVYSENTGNPPDELEILNVELAEREKIAKPDGDPKHIAVFFHRMWIQTSPLFKKPLKFNFFVLTTMSFILYFCNNGMLLWVPETVNRLAQYIDNNPGRSGTFCEAVENYKKVLDGSKTIVQTKYVNDTKIESTVFSMAANNGVKCNDSIDYSVYKLSIMIGLLSQCGLIIILLLMKVVSRKFVLATFMITSVVVVISLLILNKVKYVFYLVSAMVVATGSGIPVVTSAVVDHFPTNLRAMAVCLTLLTGRLGTICSSQIVGSILDTHCNIILYCFLALIIVCAILVIFLPRSSSSEHSRNIRKIHENGAAELVTLNLV